MITESDVRAKPDDELLDIWANQLEYVQEMIPWVKDEIERRHLDTSHIHVRTPDEIRADEEKESDRNFVRMVTWGQGVFVLLLLSVSLCLATFSLSSLFKSWIISKWAQTILNEIVYRCIIVKIIFIESTRHFIHE